MPIPRRLSPLRSASLARSLRRRDMNGGLQAMIMLRIHCWRAKSVICGRCLMKLRHESVLDLACGTGRWLERLLAQGCESGVGIDYSSAMLRVAAEKPAIRGRLARAGCEHLPLSGNCFDLAICSFAVGHIHDLELAVRELARITKSAADVFVTDLHSEAYAHGWRVGFRSDATTVQIETHLRTADEIVRLFGANGFECKMYDTLWLGEPERPIFERAGKLAAFTEACKWPAVQVCHFRRQASSPWEN